METAGLLLQRHGNNNHGYTHQGISLPPSLPITEILSPFRPNITAPNKV